MFYQTLDVYDWAALEALKCEPYQMLGSKHSFSFRLGLSFSSIVSGETHIMELLCMSSFTKTSVHTCVDRGHSGKGTKFWLQFLRKRSAANRHVCIAGVSKDISVPVNWILNNGGPLLTAGEQAVAHGLETLGGDLETLGGDIVTGADTAINGVESAAGTLSHELHHLGTTAVHGLTAGVVTAGAAVGGAVADGAGVVAAVATSAAHAIAQNPVVQQTASSIENAGAAVLHGTANAFHSFSDTLSNLWRRRLLEDPEKYLADLDFLEELKTTDHGLTILQEAHDILQLKGDHQLAAAPLRRRQLLTIIEAQADSNLVIQRLYTYSGLHGSSRKLLSFSDVVSSATNALASGTLYEHNNPLTAPTCENINVDDPYPAN